MSTLAERDAAKVNAFNLLRHRGVDIARVVRIEPDAILYVDSLGRPKTAWLSFVAAKLQIAYESGFPAWPSAASVRQLGVVRSYNTAPR